jgi:uncharacterized membrane protein
MRLLLRYFFQGLLVFIPSVLTIAIVVFVFRAVDAWMGLPVPGAGFLATVALIVVIGALASNFVTKRLFELVEGVFRRLPFVKLLYSAIRDVTDAFVGERKGFERPVFVTLDEASGVKAVGFLTRDSLDGAGLPDHVGVYLPQSYNFAGQLLVVPRRLGRGGGAPREHAERNGRPGRAAARGYRGFRRRYFVTVNFTVDASCLPR